MYQGGKVDFPGTVASVCLFTRKISVFRWIILELPMSVSKQQQELHHNIRIPHISYQSAFRKNVLTIRLQKSGYVYSGLYTFYDVHE